MARRIREGTRVLPRTLKAFKGAESFTPYLVVNIHKDGSVDLSIDIDPKTVVATRVPVDRLTRI